VPVVPVCMVDAIQMIVFLLHLVFAFGLLYQLFVLDNLLFESIFIALTALIYLKDVLLLHYHA
jgi:hypothetical protein